MGIIVYFGSRDSVIRSQLVTSTVLVPCGVAVTAIPSRSFSSFDKTSKLVECVFSDDDMACAKALSVSQHKRLQSSMKNGCSLRSFNVERALGSNFSVAAIISLSVGDRSSLSSAIGSVL